MAKFSGDYFAESELFCNFAMLFEKSSRQGRESPAATAFQRKVTIFLIII